MPGRTPPPHGSDRPHAVVDVASGCEPTVVATVICTFRRNEGLARALASVDEAAREVQSDVDIRVVIVDDDPDGGARSVVDGFHHRFLQSLHYEHSGAQNIATARNTGLSVALGIADWVAMTDDDQVVDPDWFRALVSTQRATGADAVTGPVVWHIPADAASWLRDQPFADLFESVPRPDGAPVDHCLTGNSMIRSSFLLDHAHIRFPSEFGRLGGEDMVFFRTAVDAGLDARYSPGAICRHELDAQRLTYRSYVWRGWWLGNSGALSNLAIGHVTRQRLVFRGLRRVAKAAMGPPRRRAQGHPAHWRFAGVAVAHGAGTLTAAAGIRVPHRG